MSLSTARTTRYTPEQLAAIDEAARRRRLRTGDKTESADIIRDGAGLACRGEGVAWPGDKIKDSELEDDEETLRNIASEFLAGNEDPGAPSPVTDAVLGTRRGTP